MKTKEKTVLAFDRSARSFDVDGHLRVAHCLLSSACVSGYASSELENIPGARGLDLKPGMMYRLYRDADALKASTPGLEGKPLLMRHQPISADTHPKEIVIGTITNPTFENGDVYGDLIVWDASAISAIENKELPALSMGYRYELDPTPGTTPKGERYSGRMTKIEMNHGALVDRPRIPGAMVADSASGWQIVADALQTFKKEKPMPNNGLRAFADKFKKLSDCAADDEPELSPGARLAEILKRKLTPEEMKAVTELLQLAAKAAPDDEEGERADGDDRPGMKDHDEFEPESKEDREREAEAMPRAGKTAMDAFAFRYPNAKPISSSGLFAALPDRPARTRVQSAAQRAAFDARFPLAKRIA